MAANTYGRQVVITPTNKSGGGVIAGDVVILDSSNNEAFTTTTSAAVTTPIGIAQETIASNAVGRVLFQGYAALVNVNASVTRGHYGSTHTVAKQAADAGASRTVGTFCKFLTGGTTPTATVFNPDIGLTTIRGAVNADGTVNRGTGFGSSKSSTGIYAVTFDVAFAATPVVVASAEDADASKLCHVDSVSTAGFTVRGAIPSNTLNDMKFNFIAIEA